MTFNPRSHMKKRALTVAAGLVVGVLAIKLGLYPIFGAEVLAFALFACAFNLLLAHTGLLSFGHAAFFGMGAYANALALQTFGWSPVGGLLFSVVCSAGLGLVFGAIAIRRSGIYFSMITLALAQMFYFLLLEAGFTHGEDGLQGIPRGSVWGWSLGDDATVFFVALCLFLAAQVVLTHIEASPFGRLMAAVRDNEPRAISLGYGSARVKLTAFVISAALAGLAGAIKALVLGFAVLSDAHWSNSGMVILMVLIGGLGTTWGPALGALLIISLDTHLGDLGTLLASWTGSDWFSGLGESVGLVTGLIFMLSVLAFRRGFVGTLQDVVLRFWRKP